MNNVFEYLENKKGVHVMNGEFTLCGDSFDIAQTEEDYPDGELKETNKTIVTCDKCIDIINFCKHLKTRRRRR